jgi:DNA-binding CsgD family transcriptional regulator
VCARRPDVSDPLTAREREVADLAARGLGDRDIAERLHLSVRTVQSHLYRAYQKLGVQRRADLQPGI